MKTNHSSPNSTRGSVLLVSLIFSAVIAISIASFLTLATQATQISYRTYDLGVAMNIAETGLERAMWSINRANAGGSNPWAGWTKDTAAGADYYKRSFDLGTFQGGATAVVKIYAKDTSTVPVIYARAIVTPPSGNAIEKWIQVSLARRSSVAAGVGGLGKKGITANGNNVEFASWDSDPDDNPSTPYIPYSASVKNDKMTLATLELDATLNSGQADVNGSAAVGSSSLSAIKVGTQGFIGPFGTPNGTIDPGSVSTDFSTDLSVKPAPAATYTSLGSINSNTTLPRGGDTPNADGVYYYTASGISLTNKTLEITAGANVVINMDSTLASVSVGGGSGAIDIKGTKNPATGVVTAGSLQLYTAGNVDIGGNGAGNTVSWTETTNTTVSVGVRTRVGNKWVTTYHDEVVTATSTITQPGQPKSFEIYGTRTDAQVTNSGNQLFKIHGNGNLSAVVYAPNADIQAKGGGNAGFIYGSLVGNTLLFTGNDAFYFDESLSDLIGGGASRFGIDSWREYVGYADRVALGSLMDF